MGAHLHFREIGASGTRRVTLGYRDAKYALKIFEVEKLRRDRVAAEAVADDQDEAAVEYADTRSGDFDFLALFKTQAGQHAAVRELLSPAASPTLRVKTDPTRLCGIECTGAVGAEVCTYECEGRNHGLLHRPATERPVSSYSRRLTRVGGDLFALLHTATYDEPF